MARVNLALWIEYIVGVCYSSSKGKPLIILSIFFFLRGELEDLYFAYKKCETKSNLQSNVGTKNK